MLSAIAGMTATRKGIGKKSGAPYHGRRLHLIYQRPDVEGEAVLEQYIDFQTFTELPFKVGDTVSLDFDQAGNMIDIKIIPPAKS